MIWWIIIGMLVVTYIPRMLPMVFTKDISFPPPIERWLSFIPYAALAALILPGVLTVVPEHPWAGLAAGIGAGLIAWFTSSILFSLVSAVAILFIVQNFFI